MINFVAKVDHTVVVHLGVWSNKNTIFSISLQWAIYWVSCNTSHDTSMAGRIPGRDGSREGVHIVVRIAEKWCLRKFNEILPQVQEICLVFQQNSTFQGLLFKNTKEEGRRIPLVPHSNSPNLYSQQITNCGCIFVKLCTYVCLRESKGILDF